MDNNFDLNYNGKLISNIIIFLVFIIAIILIIDQFYKLTKFTYIYTYLYNYGTLNETICKKDNNNLIEYETARFRIYNKLPHLFFEKDIFNKTWYNYIILISIIILTIIVCVSFGAIFFNLFINGNNKCEIPSSSSNLKPNDYSYINMFLDCMQTDSSNKFFISNCSFNYMILFIIIIVYPLIYLLKFFFKLDYTGKDGYYTKLFHFIIYIILFYYIYVIFKEKKEDRFILIGIYTIFVTLFIISNTILNKTYDDYYNISNTFNIYSDKEEGLVNFYDIYKQNEPIKPKEPIKPEKLNSFKNCSTTDFANTNDKLCNQYKDKQDEYKKVKEQVDEYYRKLKEYEKLLVTYNKKYSIYKNNTFEFPEIINIFPDMFIKLFGIDKSHILLLFVILIVTIIIYYLLQSYNINANNYYNNYFYNTIIIYIIGLLSIFVLSNAILTYNTYINKYIIYEPSAFYKEDLNNLNILLTALIKKEENINILNEYIDLYKLINGMDNKNNDDSTNSSETNNYEKYLNDKTQIPDFQKPSGDTFNSLYSYIYFVLYSHMFKSRIKGTITINNLLQISSSSSTMKIDNTYYRTASTNTFPLALTSNETTTMSLNVRTFLLIVKNIFPEDLKTIDETIKQLKNNLLYIVYTGVKTSTSGTITYTYTTKTYSSATNFYDTYIEENKDNKDIQEISLLKREPIITLYKQNLYIIDIIFDVYKKFLIEFRKEVINLLNITDIRCDENEYINIDSKINQFIKKLFTGNDLNFNEPALFTNTYTYKINEVEKNINMYKTVLKNKITIINDLFGQYFDTITFIMNKLFVNVDNFKGNDLENLIINNYNFYNNDVKHIKDNFIELSMNINKLYRNKYNSYKSNDLKKLKYSIDNVSWSSVIIIIIFTMILIEPTLV